MVFVFIPSYQINLLDIQLIFVKPIRMSRQVLEIIDIKNWKMPHI
jgi:hypothetical protein